MGFARMKSNLHPAAVKWTLLAFIEDALSRAEESQSVSVELHRPAAQNLRLYGMQEAELLGLARRIRERVSRDELIQDPVAVFVDENLDSLVERLTSPEHAASARLADRLIELAPVEVRLSLPFFQAETTLALPPIGAATLVTVALAGLAAVGAFGLFWITGLLEEYWRVAAALLFAGFIAAAAVALVVRVASGTAVSRAVVSVVRFLGGQLVVPVLVAIAGGIVVAYVTGVWAP
jgi:hypothetical protein